MDAQEFLDLAEKLVTARNLYAASYRAAIGRAYYASFHFAVRALDELGFPPARNANGHAQVVRLLQQCGDSTLAGAAGILGDLHGNRIKADYELHRLDVDRIQAAQAAVETARSIFDDVRSFMSEAPRKARVIENLKDRYSTITGKPPSA